MPNMRASIVLATLWQLRSAPHPPNATTRQSTAKGQTRRARRHVRTLRWYRRPGLGHCSPHGGRGFQSRKPQDLDRFCRSSEQTGCWICDRPQVPAYRFAKGST